MIQVKTPGLTIELIDINHVDLEKYDRVYTDGSEYKFSSCVNIKFISDAMPINICIAASDGATGLHEQSYILEDDRILICCSSSIFCVALPSLNLLWRTKADWATCFGLYKQRDVYIIHGEMEISRINQNGKLLWQKGGCDIFTTLEGNSNDFYITDNYIFATDWEHNTYTFDFDGNELSFKPAP